MSKNRPKGFLVLADKPFQILTEKSGILSSVENELITSNVLPQKYSLYFRKENDEVYAVYFNIDAGKYYAIDLLFRIEDCKKYFPKDIAVIADRVKKNPHQEIQAIPLEYIESYSDTNQNANNVQSSERVLSDDMPQIDISEQELKSIKKNRNAELNKQFSEINQQTLYQMLLQVRASRNMEEMKSKKREVEKLFKNTWFTDKDMEFFWKEIAPGIVRRGPQR